MTIKIKFLLFFALVSFSLGLLLILQSQKLGKLRMVFCDVGQGDATFIISPGGNQILVDAGAGTKIEDCLGRHMFFLDRTIELVAPSHPDQDHLEGFLDVLSRYRVKAVLTTNVPGDTRFYKTWEALLLEKKPNVVEADAGKSVMLDPQKGQQSARLEILWPPFAKASEGKPPAGNPSLEEWRIHPPSDLNETSVVMRLSYGGFCAYLTGDLPIKLLEPLIDRHCQVLKVVHHGSNTGTSQKLLDDIKPEVAVIQVGRNNKYGHPHREVLDLFLKHGAKVLRNDELGDIEIESDGNSYQIK